MRLKPTTKQRNRKLRLAYKRDKDALDAAARQRVLERDGRVCQRCGEPGACWSHIFSREYLITRWEDDNALCQCVGCEYFATNHRDLWHGWFSAAWPHRWAAMNEKLQSGEKYTKKDIHEMARGI